MCLLTFDTRYRSDDLNRQAALDFLSDAWLNLLTLDAQFQLLGVASKPEFRLPDEVDFEGAESRMPAALVYLNGARTEWGSARIATTTFDA